MTEGYVSDVPGDDTVMEKPTVSVWIDLSQLPPEQALALIQQGFSDQINSYDFGELAKGEDVTEELGDIEIHLPIGPALTALSSIGVVELPNEAPENVEEAAEMDEEQV